MTPIHASRSATPWLLTALLAVPGQALAAELMLTVSVEDPTLRHQRAGVVHAARVDAASVQALRDVEQVRVNLFGHTLRLERDRFDVHNGGWTWEGFSDDGEGWAVIVQHQGRIAGYLQPAKYGNAIEIVPLADGGSAWMERDDRYLPEPGQPLEPESTPTAPLGALAPLHDPHARLGGTTHVDALVAYTPAAAARVGGHAAVVARARVDVAWLNRALGNNGIDMAYRLVAVKLLPLVEPTDNDWSPLLRAFRDNTTAQAWRNQYGADMMGLYVHRETAPNCGLGYVMRNLGPGFAEWPYQYTWIDCGTRTYGHESGHNMGLEHDPGNSGVGTTPAEASRPWSFGHGVADGSNSFRTIMAYTSVCGGNPCTQVIGFSATDRYLHGHPIGVADERQNARTLDEDSKAIVSAFRVSQMIFQNGFE